MKHEQVQEEIMCQPILTTFIHPAKSHKTGEAIMILIRKKYKGEELQIHNPYNLYRETQETN